MTQPVTLQFESSPSAAAYMFRALLPARRRLELPPAIEARWRGHRADPDQLSAFLEMTGLRDGPTLPLLYPHCFGFRMTMALVTHPSFPVPIWRVLQTRNHLLQHRPIPRDAPLDFRARVSAGRVAAKGVELDVHTTVHAQGELAWESIVTFYARGAFGEPEPASPLARAPTDTGPVAARWITRDDGHWRFGRFTGDYNGIHHWDWYARKLGFPRALYRPQHVLGQCLARLAPAARDGRERLDVWLKGPVLHGAEVSLHATERAGATTFALYAQSERPSIVGRLQAVDANARLIDDDGSPLAPATEGDPPWIETASNN